MRPQADDTDAHCTSDAGFIVGYRNKVQNVNGGAKPPGEGVFRKISRA